MTTRGLNRSKKWRRCLKCGRRMYSDRCHRLCIRCREENDKQFERKTLHVVGVTGGWQELDGVQVESDDEMSLLEMAEMLEGR